MKIALVPKSNLGKWSVGLIIVMSVLFYIGMSSVNFYKFVQAGKTIPRDIIGRPLVALPMLGGFIFGISSFFCGIIGIIKKRDYSILIFASTIIGFFVLLLVFGEILFPH